MKLYSIVLTGSALAAAMVLAAGQTAKTPQKNGPQANPHSIAVDHPGGNTPNAHPGPQDANGSSSHQHSIAVDHAGGTTGSVAEKPKATPPRKHVANMKWAARGSAPGTSAQPTGTHAPVPMNAAKIKSHSNQTNNRSAQPAQSTGRNGSPKPVGAAKIKSHSNQTNN